MSIFSLGTTSVSHPLAVGAMTGASASSTQGPFSAQLQSLRAGKSDTGSAATQSAYEARPKRGSPGNAHHPHGRYASGTDSNAANGTASGLSTTGAQRGINSGGSGTGVTGTTGSTGQQSPGGVLLDSMMRGLQAYGAASTLA